jgi:hypothetical protein
VAATLSVFGLQAAAIKARAAMASLMHRRVLE